MSIGIRITLHEGLYLREPQDSVLGRKIIEHSILLIDEMGFEDFTFRKLAQAIGSTEASVYRYFENKHLLLLYLVSWYWEWVTYLIEINTRNIEDPRQKLQVIIHSFVYASLENPDITFVNESKLHNIIISEGSKVYHTKDIDTENEKGFFLNYKQLIRLVSDVILQIDPSFPFPHALATNLFEISCNHIYFAEHLPGLTDVSKKAKRYDEVEAMLNFFVERMLGE